MGEKDGKTTAFQKYIAEKHTIYNLESSNSMRRIELAAALDKLFTEYGYEYYFNEEVFSFVLTTSLPVADDAIKFTSTYLVSPPYIIVSVCPKTERLSRFTNVEAARETVKEFQDVLRVGSFTVSDLGELVFCAYTDWYGGSEDVPGGEGSPADLFLHYLLKLPMYIWVMHLNTVLLASEGSVDVVTAKQQIRETQEKYNFDF
ncbi:MAG: hypothetical protein LBS21_07760 [Clostridiales bacterium]|jgi:hypothetical protein|nr:hypothetical protein [Clostridiales bacterium]